MFCDKCGKKLEAEAAFCEHCGAPTGALSSSGITEKLNTSSTTPFGAPDEIEPATIADETLPAETGSFCDKCGAQLEKSAAFCPECGAAAFEEATHEQPTAQIPAQPGGFVQQSLPSDQKKALPKWVLPVVIVAALIVIGAGVAIGLSVSGGSSPEDTKAITSAEEPDSRQDKEGQGASPEKEAAEAPDTNPVGYWVHQDKSSDGYDLLNVWRVEENGTASLSCLSSMPNSGGGALYSWKDTTDTTANGSSFYAFAAEGESSKTGGDTYTSESGQFYIDKTTGELVDERYTFRRVTKAELDALYDELDEATKSAEQSRERAGNDYLIADSATRLLSESELSSYSSDDLVIAQNEIWARHGRQFKNQWLQNYFNSKSWYNGTIPADDFLNRYKGTDTENANALLISSMLDARGYDVNRAHPNG